MTSSDDSLLTKQVDVLSSEELNDAIKRWEAPHMVTVSDVEDNAPLLDLDALEALQKQAQEEGYQEGHQTGYEAGLKQALEAGQQQVNEQVEQLQQIISTLQQPLLDLDEQIEADLVTLSLTVARQLIRRELKQQPEHVIAAMRAALQALPVSERALKIYVHPDDMDIIRSGLSMEQGNDKQQWITDPLLSRGGVRLETADTSIDATVESRLNSLISQVLGEERGTGDEQSH